MTTKLAPLLILLLAAALACNGGEPSQDELKADVVAALDELAAELAADRPADASGYAPRLQAYLEANPDFYGSAAALLDADGAVTASPYVIATTTATPRSTLPFRPTTLTRRRG